MATIVRSQQELDRALADGVEDVVINSPSGVVLRVGGESCVRVGGESCVRVGDSATIQYVGDSATIQYVGDSATIQYVGDSATIQYVGDSATIQYVGDSATIQYVGDSATIQYVADSATIQYVADSATIHAYGGSIIDASRYVAIHLHDPRTWCEYHGVPVSDGVALVVKCVDGDLMAGQNHKPTMYPIGGTVSATDWDAGNHCGNGLHFSATTAQAFGCFQGDKRGSVRFLECSVDVGSMVVLSDDKAKAPSCRVLREIGQI
jgi:hypothetical protein